MATRRIIAVFDSQEAARQAQAELVQLGLRPEEVSIVDQQTPEVSGQTARGDRGGFWAHLKEMFMPDEDRATLDESIRRGGYVLSARVSEAQADEAIRCLDNAGAVDLEQREAQWRGADGDRISGSASMESGDARQTQAIPVVQERLRVGKREVDRGSVRVRSYIVEEPVHEQVHLRDERVEVERRPVNEPAQPVAKGSPEDLMQERTIDVTETSEQAVVAKEAVITEEVRIRKTANDRVENIDDTVRRTEVDVQDGRTSRDPPRGTRPQSPGRR